MRKTPLKKVSSKQRAEIKNRQKLKTLLLNEQTDTQGCNFCSTCGLVSSKIGAGFLELAHIVALSRGGKTEYGNCVIEGGNFLCGCSARFEKRAWDRPKTSIGYQKYLLQLEEP